MDLVLNDEAREVFQDNIATFRVLRLWDIWSGSYEIHFNKWQGPGEQLTSASLEGRCWTESSGKAPQNRGTKEDQSGIRSLKWTLSVTILACVQKAVTSLALN